MGNTAVMKLPNYGVVCHYLTYQLFKDIFPAGVINIGILNLNITKKLIYIYFFFIIKK